MYIVKCGLTEVGERVEVWEEGAGWSRGPDLPEKREGAACARLGDTVFVSGGYNRATNQHDGATLLLELGSQAGSAHLARLIVLLQVWRRAGPLSWARHDHGMAVRGGRLLAFGGGYSGDTSVEEWDWGLDGWYDVQSSVVIRKIFIFPP